MIAARRRWLPVLLVASLPDAAAAQPEPAIVRVPAAEALPLGAVVRIGTTRLRDIYPVVAVAFSAGGKRLAWGNENGQVWICETATGKPLLEVWPDPKGQSPVSELAFSPDGRLLAAGGFWAADVRVIDLEQRRLLHA